MTPDPELLRRVPVFGGLREDTLQFILERAKVVHFEPGETLFTDGELGSNFYIIDTGTVEVRKARDSTSLVLSQLASGDSVGEMSLLAVMPRSATAVATSAVEAACISNRDLFALYESDVEQFAIIVMNMGREVARRLWVTNELLIGYASFLEFDLAIDPPEPPAMSNKPVTGEYAVVKPTKAPK